MVLRSMATRGKREYLMLIPAGFKSQQGTIHALLVTRQGERYRVAYRDDCHFACRREVAGQQEPCNRDGSRCLHVQALERVALLFGEDGILTMQDAPEAVQYLYSEYDSDDELATSDAVLAGVEKG